MKKSIIKTIILLLFVASCTSEQTEEYDKPLQGEALLYGLKELEESRLNASDFGRIHNQMLEVFMKNKPEYTFQTFNILTRDIEIEFKKTGLNIFKLDVNFQRIEKKIPLGNNLLSRSDLNYYSWISETYESLVSKELKEAFDEILFNNLTFPETEKTLKKLEKDINLSESESKGVELFIEIARYSNEFWTEYNKNTGNITTGRCDPTSQQYLADAFGGLIFGGLGAVGYSWAANEIQKSQYDGGCIR